MHTAFLICEAPALEMLLLYKSLYLTYDLQKREESSVKIILLVAKWRGSRSYPKGEKKGKNIKLGLFGIIGTDEEKTNEKLTKQILVSAGV